jgi:hypothetical protein
VTRRYITFGDIGCGRVLSEGEIKVSDKITLRRVVLVQSQGYNLLSVSQLLDEGFEVLFRPGDSQILDSRGDLVVWTSLGPLPWWVPGPTTRWAPGTTRLALHGI